MSAGPLSIKLRCTSWQQLATIYKRDLSRGAMFLKASTPPPIGTSVKVELMLPSASVIVLAGTVANHVNDPQRGGGVELQLAPLPAQSVWLIESALASESKRTQTQTPPTGVPAVQPVPALTEEADLVGAEADLVKALVAEAESLKKLNPFLVLGVGYEASDADVRAAFGELTKRYHPDLFARYDSTQLRSVAAEIFILIRDAYRRLGDEAGRRAALQQIGRTPAPRAVPNRAPTPAPVAVAPPRMKTPPGQIPRLSTSPGENVTIPTVKPPPIPRVPPVPPPLPRASTEPPIANDAPTARPQDQPTTRPSTPLPIPPEALRNDVPAARPLTRSGPVPTVPMPPSQPIPRVEGSGGLPRSATPAQGVPRIATPAHGIPRVPTPAQPMPRMETAPIPPVLAEGSESDIDSLLEQGKFDEAVMAVKILARKQPNDRTLRAAVEVCEGLRAMAQRDRLEGAQRFEAALEIDPSNERAARELADMRRQATNERKGLLTRLMGKKD